jgi:hypothetical protein
MSTPASDATSSQDEGDMICGLTRAERRLTGSIGGLRSWANMDPEAKAARLEKARSQSPLRIAWHARRRGWDPDRLTPDQQRRCEQDLRAYQMELAFKSAKARRKRKGREGRPA